jgi:hypothetical protein
MQMVLEKAYRISHWSMYAFCNLSFMHCVQAYMSNMWNKSSKFHKSFQLNIKQCLQPYRPKTHREKRINLKLFDDFIRWAGRERTHTLRSRTKRFYIIEPHVHESRFLIIYRWLRNPHHMHMTHARMPWQVEFSNVIGVST